MKTFQIQYDETKLVYNGKQYEPTGEFRVPRKGEFCISQRGTPVTFMSEQYTEPDAYPRIILREAWEWPSWLKGWGIAMDECGAMYLYEEEPVMCEKTGTWDEQGEENYRSVDCLNPWWVEVRGLTPPTITDWKTPILNPNYVAPVKEDSDIEDDGAEYDPEEDDN